MRPARIAFAFVCLLVSAAAFAQTALTATPNTFYQYASEESLTLSGTGIAGSDHTAVVFSGRAGTFLGNVNPLNANTILMSVPPFVTQDVGTWTVEVDAYDTATGTPRVYSTSISILGIPQTNSPLLGLPESVNAEAVNSDGAPVTFSATAINDDGSPVAVTCDHTSGALYPIGSTRVSCSATNSFGTSTGSFVIFVTDTVGPVLTVPSDIFSTNPVVTWTASATDAIDGTLPVTCSPASGSTFVPGTTVVTCKATDSHANATVAKFKVEIPGGPPTLTLPADIVVEATSGAGAVVTYSATTDVDATVACSPASGSTFALNVTTVNCTATNASQSVSGTFNVIVIDTTPPLITVPSTITAEATSAAGATVTYTATASDLVDGTVGVTCSPISGSTFALGSTTVNCTSTDAHSNTATKSFTITVVDTTPPVITVPGTITAEATGAAGAAVTYTVAASDVVDGTVGVTCSPISGSTFALGSTSVNCTSTDAHSNTATKSFTITVVDTTPPVITVPSTITAEATSAAGATVTYTVTASDLAGTVGVTCSPISGSTFALGSTTVNCTSTDAHSNTATKSFTITVVDTTPPTITAPGTITAEATSAAGATVTYTVTASDLVDGTVGVTCSLVSGSTFALGSTTVNCTSTDAHSNTATKSFTITVVDTTPPTITAPGTVIAQATSVSGATVNYTVTATDLVDGTVGVTCSPASGTTFAMGSTSVDCTAIDSNSNATSVSFLVTVIDAPPTITRISVSPSILWPPNHTMVPVTVTATATDFGDPHPTVRILSISSNQAVDAVDAGDAVTSPDWVITGPLTANLRAERTSGVDRIYTIVIQAVDFSNNSTTASVQVKVTPQPASKTH